MGSFKTVLFHLDVFIALLTQHSIRRTFHCLWLIAIFLYISLQLETHLYPQKLILFFYPPSRISTDTHAMWMMMTMQKTPFASIQQNCLCVYIDSIWRIQHYRKVMSLEDDLKDIQQNRNCYCCKVNSNFRYAIECALKDAIPILDFMKKFRFFCCGSINWGCLLHLRMSICYFL